MNEEPTTTIFEQPVFDDAIAARGEAILRMCVAVNQVKRAEARAALLKAVERITASIPVAPGERASILNVAGKNRL